MAATPGRLDICYGTSLPARRRRQKHSCDQCRKGKRACDAGLPPPAYSSSVSHTLLVQRNGMSASRNNSECPVLPCTNCQKGKKRCTFEWLSDLRARTTQDGKRKGFGHVSRRSSAPIISSYVQHTKGLESLAYVDSQNSEQVMDPFSVLDSPEKWQNDVESRMRRESETFANRPPPHVFWSTPLNNLDSLQTGQDYSERGATMNTSIIWNTEYDSHPSESGNLDFDEPNDFYNVRRRRKLRAQFLDQPESVPSLLSQLDMTETSSRHFMTNGLLRVYHDSMENALSCWLTEYNCPYTNPTRRMNPALDLQSENITMSNWSSNRIYSRVCHLDRAYSSIRSRSLTTNEERMASKALNLAVLSFAAQWPQAGDRSTKCPGAEGNQQNAGVGSYTDTFPHSDEFGRSMQETLWHQASRVLHEAMGIESFKVIFALIVFSLTQRPLDMTQTTSQRPAFRDLQDIIGADGPPLFLEVGLRQIFSYRRKLEDLEREQTVGSSSEGIGRKQSLLRREDRETCNLLFWLGIMFDTLSAAMSHRPLVVEDEDTNTPIKACDNSPQISRIASDIHVQAGKLDDLNALEKPQLPNDLWGDHFLFVKTSTAEPTRWPCSFQLAASTLSDAAPFKVLLFRRVARLQTLLSRQSEGAELETAINDAFHVYDYWNRMYGPFVLDCVANHDELPARIQSWYILIAGHWHLATFLLADLIEEIDSTNLSLLTERRARQCSHFVPKLRQENAHAVSELSRSSLHGSQGRSFIKSREFHFAVNKSALLTEPWTVVLIRSFSRAGYILAEAAVAESQNTFVQQPKQRCESCIEALWLLGKKSDMALLAARFLANMLNGSYMNTASATATEDIQPSMSGERRHSDYSNIDASYPISDHESSFDTAFSGFAVASGFGLDSVSRDSIPDLQCYSTSGDTITGEEGSNGSPCGSQYYDGLPFENAESLLFC